MGKDKKPKLPIETTAAYRGGPCMLDVGVVWSLPKIVPTAQFPPNLLARILAQRL